MNDVFSLLTELGKVSGRDKRKIQNQIFKALSEDVGPLESFTRNACLSSVKNNLHSYGVTEEFITVSTTSYKDDKDKTKIAIIVSFLQDYTNHSENLNEELLSQLVSKIKSLNIDFVVDDISVNGLQWPALK